MNARVILYHSAFIAPWNASRKSIHKMHKWSTDSVPLGLCKMLKVLFISVIVHRLVEVKLFNILLSQSWLYLHDIIRTKSWTCFATGNYSMQNKEERRHGAVGSGWSVDTCQSWVQAPSKAPVVSLSKKLYSNCLVLVASRYGFECDLHKQKIVCFTIELK